MVKVHPQSTHKQTRLVGVPKPRPIFPPWAEQTRQTGVPGSADAHLNPDPGRKEAPEEGEVLAKTGQPGWTRLLLLLLLCTAESARAQKPPRQTLLCCCAFGVRAIKTQRTQLS